MQLFINGQNVDVTLEGEKTAWDVIDSLTKVLAEEDKIITGVVVDGETYSSDNEALQNVLLTSVQKIEFEVSPKEEVMRGLLNESVEICSAIADDLKANGYAHVDQYKDVMQWILEVIDIFQALYPVQMTENAIIRTTIKDLLSHWQSDDRPRDDSAQSVQVMRGLSQYFQLLAQRTTMPMNVEREELESAFDELLEMLPQISESFQVGQDKVALDKIYKVLSVMELSVLYLRQNAKELSSREDEVEDMTQSLNALLSDIVTAFEKSDVVLLGDLFEYELPEKIEAYKTIVWGK